jgi:hypothetical protein
MVRLPRTMSDMGPRPAHYASTNFALTRRWVRIAQTGYLLAELERAPARTTGRALGQFRHGK